MVLTRRLAAVSTLVAGMVAAGMAATGRAEAAAARTFVSGKGVDTNPCTITAPCRSFQQAVNQTAAGGEVVALDPGGYGTVSITQAISLVNDGVGTVSISVPANGAGVGISAGANDSVHLRGIEIDGNNAGGNIGINISGNGTVELLNCIVRHLDFGIFINTTQFGMVIRKSIVSDNSNLGLYAQGSYLNLVLDHDQFASNDGGIHLNATNYSYLNITHCFISALTSTDSAGIYNANGRVFLSYSEITGFSDGASTVGSDAVTLVYRSTITGNTIGLHNYQGSIFTYSNNAINYNTQADESGTIQHYAPE